MFRELLRIQVASPGKNEPPNDSELQNQLRLKLHRIRQERANVRTVVFFGDGTFGPTMRGHNAGPQCNSEKRYTTRALSQRSDVPVGRVLHIFHVPMRARQAKDDERPPPCSQKRWFDMLSPISAWRQMRPRRPCLF